MPTDWTLLTPLDEGNKAFQESVTRLLKREGGEVDDPDDAGGHTKYGISQRAFPDVHIPGLTKSDAMALYRKHYWDEIDANNLPAPLREVAFDAAVNQGVGFAKRALKEAGGSVERFIELRREKYKQIVDANPKQAKFLRGWLKRLEEVTPKTDWSLFKPITEEVDWSVFTPLQQQGANDGT